jgi:hypothetical protein
VYDVIKLQGAELWSSLNLQPKFCRKVSLLGREEAEARYFPFLTTVLKEEIESLTLDETLTKNDHFQSIRDRTDSSSKNKIEKHQTVLKKFQKTVNVSPVVEKY